MLWRSRSLLLSIAGVAYVFAAALRASTDRAYTAAALLVFPALVGVWTRSAPPARGEDWVSPVTRSAMRCVAFGGALTAAARVAPHGLALFEAAATLGTAISSTAALIALARIAPLGGIFRVPKGAARLRLAIVCALVGGAATILPICQAAGAEGELSDPLFVEVSGALAPGISLMLTIVVAHRARRLRRLDLGAAERLSAALVAAWIALVVGVPASLLGIAPAAHVLESAAFCAAAVSTAACLARDPAWVARVQRVVVAVTMLGAPVALFGASVAMQAPSQGPLVALVVLAGVLIGLTGPSVARPLAPEQSRWIDAIDAATQIALRGEPESALVAALAALRQALGPASTSPELWRVEPPGLVTVDRAGYAHVAAGVVAPSLLYELAEGEPERTLRTDVLETLEVRRADIRPPLAWLRDRGAMSFTLLNDEEGPLGALVLPAATRTHPLTLEEVRALRTLADRLTALIAASSALARARSRELEARTAGEREMERALHLRHLVEAAAEHNEALARRTARNALVAPYSTAARQALEEIERLAKASASIALLVPPGTDPAPYAAFSHGAGTRASKPFVIVDAAGQDEQKESHWQDPKASPLVLADGGSLFVASVAALPSSVQIFLADALAERRSPAGHGAPLDVSLIVSVPTTIDTLVATGQLETVLADRLGDRAIPIPPLAARADDLRALFVERLARIGVRLKGRPLGLDPRALARLVEHAWPGNEVELDAVLTRAATIVDGEVVTAAHLDQIGFVVVPAVPKRSSRPARGTAPDRVSE